MGIRELFRRKHVEQSDSARVSTGKDAKFIAESQETSGEVVVFASPDIIDLADHPLKYLPGFSDFVEDWNNFVIDTRPQLQMAVEDAKSTLEIVSQTAEREIESINSKRVNTEGLSTKTQKRKRNSVGKESRRARKRRDKFTEAELSNVKNANEALDSAETDFAFGPGERRLVYFAVERLGEDREAVDMLFIEYSKRGNIDKYALRSINHDYERSIGKVAGKEYFFDENWKLAGEAVVRQRPELVEERYRELFLGA